MSMRYYPVSSYGVILDKAAVTRVFAKAFPEDKEFDTEEKIVALVESDVIVDYDLCDGYFTHHDAKGITSDYECFGSDERILFMPLKRDPTLFEAAYSSFGEAITELRESCNHALSEKYIKANFGLLEGMLFG